MFQKQEFAPDRFAFISAILFLTETDSGRGLYKWGLRMIEVGTCSATNKKLVRLAGSLDVRNANGLQGALSSLLSEEPTGKVDCSALESLDTACVQLLLAAKRDSRGAVEIVFDPAGEIAKWFDYAGATANLRASTTNELASAIAGESRS